MKTKSKVLLGAAAVAFVGVAGAGAHYVQDEVLPERIAADLNSSFADIYQKNKLSDDVTVTKSGDITVERTGLFEYKAVMPSVKVEVQNGDLQTVHEFQPSEYNVTVKDRVGALFANENTEIEATLTAAAPVEFTTNFSTRGYDYVRTDNGYEKKYDGTLESVANVKGVCDSVVTDAKLQGGKYTLNTTGSDCSIKGTAGQENSREGLNFTSAFEFTNNIANDGKNVFTGENNLKLKDFMAIVNEWNGTSTVKIGEMNVNLGYGNMTALDKLPTKIEDFDLSLLPDNFKFSLDVKDLALAFPRMEPKEVVFSFGAGLGLEGLKGDEAGLNVRFNYDLGNLEEIVAANPRMSAPDAASCDASLGKVPLKKLTDIMGEVAEATGGNLSPEDLITQQGVVAKALQDAGSSLDLNCKSSKGEIYSNSVEASHVISEGGFPGEGKLEVRGVEEILNDLSQIFGPSVMGINEMIIPLAQPTEDGKGLQWKYKLDEKGNLEVNEMPLGPVVPPMPK